VGPAIGARRNRSKLYDPSHAHLFRRRRVQFAPSPPGFAGGEGRGEGGPHVSPKLELPPRPELPAGSLSPLTPDPSPPGKRGGEGGGRATPPRATILLLSGTSEGPPLARLLHAAGYRVRATVTRAEAVAHLFGSIGAAAEVEVRGFTEE